MAFIKRVCQYLESFVCINRLVVCSRYAADGVWSEDVHMQLHTRAWTDIGAPLERGSVPCPDGWTRNLARALLHEWLNERGWEVCGTVGRRPYYASSLLSSAISSEEVCCRCMEK